MPQITYGFYPSTFGEMVIAQSERGLCWLGFMVDGYKGNGFDRMAKHFPDTPLARDDAAIKPLGDEVIKAWANGTEKDIQIDLKGTAFQRSVWAALLDIPRGAVKSYGDVANDIGKPKASRAVGSAVGENPVSLIVPCHRVLQKSGAVGNYGWGVDIKRQILRAEGLNI